MVPQNMALAGMRVCAMTVSPHLAAQHIEWGARASDSCAHIANVVVNWPIGCHTRARSSQSMPSVPLFARARTRQSSLHRMEAAAEILRRMPPRVYHHDFDDNGILNYVATNGGTTAYVNPHTSGKVIVTPSSIYPGHGTVEGFIGRLPPRGHTLTNDAAGSSVAIQLPLPVSVTRYTLRNGRATTDMYYVLRNWNFEGSNDGVEWAVLRQHANDQSIALQAHSTASWDADNGLFTHRILATGPDSSGSNIVAVGGLELYGQVAGVAPGQVSHPLCVFLRSSLFQHALLLFAHTSVTHAHSQARPWCPL
jgi:hypothetical protein